MDNIRLTQKYSLAYPRIAWIYSLYLLVGYGTFQLHAPRSSSLHRFVRPLFGESPDDESATGGNWLRVYKKSGGMKGL